MTGELWTIIIVDDDRDDREDVRRMLLGASERRFRLVDAETGAAGLRALGDAAGALEGPLCIVLDFNLPDMNALEFLAAMTGGDGVPRAPVVVITGDDTEALGRASLRAGAHDYVGKRWITPQGLVRAIESASERWAMARELHRRQQELESIADNTPSLLIRFDRALRHVYVNTATLSAMGVPPSQMLGRTHRDIGLDHRWWEAALVSVFESRMSARFEFTLGSSASTRQYLATLVPELNASGVVETVLCVAHDETDRRQIEQVLRNEDRRRTDFLATLAHELRNPLAPIRTGLEILSAAPAPSPAARQALESMARHVRHLVRLVDDLVEVARISSGKISLRSEPFPVRVAIEQAIEASRRAIDVAGHTLHVSLPAEPIWVNGDLVRLCQIISNLLNNAARYTPRNGRIEIVLACTHAEAVLQVIDNGVGIAPANLEAIFGMYVQLAQSDDIVPGGLGIGLSLVRHLAELHGGSVTVESEGLGMGSAFTLRLPRIAPVEQREADAAAPTTMEQHRSALPRGDARRRRVLIVDDNEDAALTLALSLDLSGHQTSTAHSGRGALERLASFQAELAFVDLGMPGMSGYDVAEVIRADPALAGITLVALTGHGSPDDKERARAAGFHFHLTKPVEFSEVESILMQVEA